MIKGLAIFKVCYNDNTKKDFIKSVKAARFTSHDGRKIDIVGNIVSWSKGQIIDMLMDTSEESRVFTATVEDDKYYLESEVEVYTGNESKYIRIKGSTSEKDDLDMLPVYVAHC